LGRFFFVYLCPCKPRDAWNKFASAH
jgi:hypothetical protein